MAFTQRVHPVELLKSVTLPKKLRMCRSATDLGQDQGRLQGKEISVSIALTYELLKTFLNHVS